MALGWREEADVVHAISSIDLEDGVAAPACLGPHSSPFTGSFFHFVFGGLIRQTQGNVGGDGGAPRRNASCRQAFAERRRRRSAAARRRKLESVGSFSVNLSLYDGERGRGGRTTWEETRGSDPEENAVEVFEDDTPSPSHRDRSRAAPPIATPRRPGTPAPCLTPITAYVDTGSFFEATSLFASSKGEDGASSDSSTASASQDKTWELRTVDEDATPAGW